MKKIFLFLFTVCLTSFSFAQFCDYEEVVYLKNSKVYRGIIIEQIPGKSLKLKSNDQKVYDFDISEVEKFTRELKKEVLDRQEILSKKDFLEDDYSTLKIFKAHPKYLPSGFYLNSNFVMLNHRIGFGVGGGITIGGKIFNYKKESKRIKVGADLSFVADFLHNLNSTSSVLKNKTIYHFGLQAGPSIAFRLKGPWYFYLTPFSGFNILTYKYSLHSPQPIPSPTENYARKVDFALPFGLKLEYAYKRLFFGGNVMAAYSRYFEQNSVYFRSSLNLGVKF